MPIEDVGAFPVFLMRSAATVKLSNKQPALKTSKALIILAAGAENKVITKAQFRFIY